MAEVPNFPGNSKNEKDDTPPSRTTASRPVKKAVSKVASKPADPKEKEVKAVVAAPVIHKKPTFAQKFKDVFVGGEFKSVVKSITAEVLLPAVRDTIVNVTTKGVERMIYGDRPPPNRPIGGLGSTSRILYNNAGGRYAPNGRGFLPGESNHVRPQGAMGDYILNSAADAEAVMAQMQDIIDAWQCVSLADFHALLDLPSSYTDQNWGWTSLRFFDIQQTRDGWLLRLPNYEPLG